MKEYEAGLRRLRELELQVEALLQQVQDEECWDQVCVLFEYIESKASEILNVNLALQASGSWDLVRPGLSRVVNE